MFDHNYTGKKVLITGHTGFKGSWLAVWLLKLGAEVIGISKDIPTEPSMFHELELRNQLRHYLTDIRDLCAISRIIQDERPDFVFHLAAQAIVSVSYSDPVETITSNAVGTMNILEALRKVDWPCVAVLITSDKCYANVEWVWGYKETDSLGGKDIYSGSKGAAELIIKSYLNSFFLGKDHPVRVGIGRAGNVIGGGDWAKDRIVVDCFRSWFNGNPVEIRCPRATRPWQHVLEPLSGYLRLGSILFGDNNLSGEAFNFGPRAEQNRTVIELLSDLSQHWGYTDPKEAYFIADNLPFHEAGLLKLNCDKALVYLKWESNMDYNETICMVSEWYSSFYKEACNMLTLTMEQIDTYEAIAMERNRSWAD